MFAGEYYMCHWERRLGCRELSTPALQPLATIHGHGRAGEPGCPNPSPARRRGAPGASAYRSRSSAASRIRACAVVAGATSFVVLNTAITARVLFGSK